MKFDLTKFPVGEDDKQLRDEKNKAADFRVTLMKACTCELDENSQPVRGEEKYKRYDMWQRFKNATDSIDLTAEEVVMLTKLSCIAYPVLVAGQCRDFLAKPEDTK